MISKYAYLDFAEVVLSIGNTRGEGPVAPSLSLQTKVSPYAVTKWHRQTVNISLSYWRMYTDEDPDATLMPHPACTIILC